ncbi:MarR family winged helix-turn-helix transcriptional regulator [Ruania suaedae]|uniref:MarR family winged helix-turn-helix transcriptional regulator n=1 Tax=Ruania suaedae TaxID=2897774 RepID=UPI001E4561F3|nr:MarR family winged helix-turn-helix transcriptional regulator [Ruania suaedae]UFU02582.1 MarR family winged helix-turn-helix transcriptional regulator [Ruania suaedae]
MSTPESHPAAGSAELAAAEAQVTAFWRRARYTSRSLASQVHPQLDASGYTVLATIDDLQAPGTDGEPGSGVRAQELTERLALHKSRLSRVITELEGLGLLERTVDPQDARARLLRLTPSGAESLREARRRRRAVFSARLARWSPADLGELARLLGRLNEDLRPEGAGGGEEPHTPQR